MEWRTSGNNIIGNEDKDWLRVDFNDKGLVGAGYEKATVTIGGGANPISTFLAQLLSLCLEFDFFCL